MNSKYTGEQVEAILDKAEISDSFKIGEIRCCSSFKNIFGDDYVFCAGQEVSLEKYPKAAEVLPISGITNARRLDPPVMPTTPPFVDMQDYVLFSINNSLLGRIRKVTIPPKDTSNVTPEDMVTMFSNIELYLDVSEDGINWIEKHKFPKQQEIIHNPIKVDILNDKLVIFCQIGTVSLIDEAPTINIQGNIIFATNDFKDFKNWTEYNFILPGEHNNDEFALIRSAYGNGIYAIMVETARTSNRKMLGFFKSTDLINWEYFNDDLGDWTDISGNSGESGNILFCGGYFILQFMYTFMFSDPDLMIQSIVGGKGADADGDIIDGILLGVECMRAGDILEYYAITKNKLFTISKNNTGGWESQKQSIPNDFGEIFAIKALGGNLGVFVFSKYKNKYLVYPTDNISTDFIIEGDSSGQSVSYVGLHQVNGKLYLEDQGSVKNVLVDFKVNAPVISIFAEYGLFGYVKLK